MKIINIFTYVFLLAKCDYPPPPDPDHQQPFLFSLNYLDLVNGKYREGDKAYFKCELGIGNKIMYHPSVCQANGEWTQFRCEGIRFTDSIKECAYSIEVWKLYIKM